MEKQFIGVFVFSGIISHIESYDTLETGIKEMNAFFEEHRFDFREDDARIFEAGTHSQVYSFDHEEYEKKKYIQHQQFQMLLGKKPPIEAAILYHFSTDYFLQEEADIRLGFTGTRLFGDFESVKAQLEAGGWTVEESEVLSVVPVTGDELLRFTRPVDLNALTVGDFE